MAINGVTPKVSLVLGSTGTAYASKLEVRVEDAAVRQQQGADFDGLEKVYAQLTRKDGTKEKVELPYLKSVDPSPVLSVETKPNTGIEGPHSGHGPTLVNTPSGRVVDVYALTIDADHYQDVGHGKQITFSVETNKGELVTQAPSEVLWK